MTRHACVLIVLGAISLTGCGAGSAPGGEGAASAEPKVPKDQIVLSPQEQATGKIETQAVVTTTAPAFLHVSGRIARADDRTWRVGVRTNGLVRMVPVNLGDAVTKDQVLARYHADEVREERAKFRTAISNLQRLEAAAALAARNLDRAQSLLALKAASQLQVEQAKQDQVSAEAAVKNGRIEVDRARMVLEDELHVKADPAGPGEADDLVPILAPAAGYVLEKNVTPGRTIAPGQDAFVIGDLSQVWMLASVKQDHLAAIRLGQPAIIRVPGFGDQAFTGRIANLGQEIDPITRVMPVRIVLQNPGDRLRPEMLATADIPMGDPAPVLRVLSDAIQQIEGQDIVFLRTAPDRFLVRAVRVGQTFDKMTTVVEGLKAGDEVVVKGSYVLKSHLFRSKMEGE